MPAALSQHAAVESNRSNRRQHRRVLFSLPFTVQHLVSGLGIRSTRGISLDISCGGMGAIVQGSLRVGEAVVIELPTPSMVLKTPAIVRHTSSLRSGFEFLALQESERQQLSAISGAA
jgi:c-di-GMP-binding flagellar brake protein YcgR